MQGVVSSVRTGYTATAPNEVMVEVTRRLGPDPNKPAVIWAHGHGADAIQGYTPAYTLEVAQAIAQAGYLYLAVDTGGAHEWGSSNATGRCLDAMGYAQQRGARQGKHFIMGFSMGALTAVRFADIGSQYLLGAMAMNLPADLEAVATVGSEYDTDLKNMHGADWRTNQTTLRNLSPKRMLEDGADPFTVPIQCWHSTNDPTTPAQPIIDFAQAIGRPSISMGAIAHSPAGAKPVDVLAFLEEFDA